jgi:uncharacterized membrane protein YeaQ/YmgE (transglycosylase-associated protein family)
MGIILWIIFGALVGWITSMFMGTNQAQGLGQDIVVGIIGALLGGWLMSLVGKVGITGFNVYSFIVAVIGAVILIIVVKALRRIG